MVQEFRIPFPYHWKHGWGPFLQQSSAQGCHIQPALTLNLIEADWQASSPGGAPLSRFKPELRPTGPRSLRSFGKVPSKSLAEPQPRPQPRASSEAGEGVLAKTSGTLPSRISQAAVADRWRRNARPPPSGRDRNRGRVCAQIHSPRQMPQRTLPRQNTIST